jgi:tRNA A37 methylthiotransferase MiaB
MALIGRLATQAPEIDGVVYLSETESVPGEFVEVTISDATEYDLMGTAKDQNTNDTNEMNYTERGTMKRIHS